MGARRRRQSLSRVGTLEGRGYERPGDDTEHGTGAVRWLRYGRTTIAEQILEVDDGRRVVYTVVRGMPVRHYRAEVTLTPIPGGTRIDWAASWDRTLTGPIVRHKLRSVFPEIVGRLAVAAARRAAAP